MRRFFFRCLFALGIFASVSGGASAATVCEGNYNTYANALAACEIYKTGSPYPCGAGAISAGYEVCGPAGTPVVYFAGGGSTAHHWVYNAVCEAPKFWDAAGKCVDPCPAGQEPVNGVCVAACPAGQTRNAEGVCESPCQGLAGTVVGAAGAYYPASSCAGSVCISSCLASSSGCTAIGVGTTKEYYAEGPFTISGSECSETQQSDSGIPGGSITSGAADAGTPIAPTAGDCLDMGKGYIQINDAVTCAEPSPENPVEKTFTTVTTTTAPDNTVSTTTETTTVTNDGERTTVSKLNQPSDGPASSTETTSDNDGPGDGTGTNLGTPSDGLELGSKDVGVGLVSVVVLPGVAECPASIPLPLGAEFSFSGICQMAEGIRYVVLTMAWIFAALLIAGAIKEG